MPEGPHPFFQEISKIALLLEEEGFGESFFGNISALDRRLSRTEGSTTYPLIIPRPELAGSSLFITRTGSTMANVASDPYDDIGRYLIEVNRVVLVEGVGPPSTELEAHLAIHSKLGLERSAVVHCHIGGLLPALESMDPVPGWIRVLPGLRPGSPELAKFSGDAAGKDVLLVWKGHGIVSASDTLSRAYSLIERSISFSR